MSRPSRPNVGRARGAVLAAAALAVTLALPTSAVARDTDGMPVTVDDTLGVDGRGTGIAAVLANDTDPDGDDLEICRVTVPEEVPLLADNFDDVLYIQSLENVTGSYEVTYYVCDFEHLTPGTLTVEVTRVPEVRVTTLKRPGRLKFTNPGSTRVVVLYGNRNNDEPDGQVGIAPSSSEKVRVTRKKIYYVAFVRRTGSLAGEGIVKGIELRRTTSSSRAVVFRAPTLRVWSAHG